MTSVVAGSHSSSELLTTLLQGPTSEGAAFSRHELRFGDYIVALTRAGAPRMPNGIECGVSVSARVCMSIGLGKLVVGKVEISPGPGWDPVPVFEPIACTPAGPEPLTGSSGTWPYATEPTSSVLLAGYVAGLALLHGQMRRADQVASRAMRQLGPAAATLLRHAARGEVPEPLHNLLVSRNASSLISSSPLGIAWLRGLVSAGLPLDLVMARTDQTRRTA